ncbi:MAG: hypothetical protein JSU87_09735, partial [Gemmatimonadota bacterium]
MTRRMMVLGLAGFAAGAALTYALFPEPFGRAFTRSLALCVVGMLMLLAAMGIGLLRARWFSIRLLAVVPLGLAALLALLTAVVATDVRVLFFKGLPPDPNPAEWQEDLDFLAEQMIALHPDLFSLVPEERFDSAVAATRSIIPRLTDEQTLMALFRIVALPNDAHT